MTAARTSLSPAPVGRLLVRRLVLAGALLGPMAGTAANPLLKVLPPTGASPARVLATYLTGCGITVTDARIVGAVSSFGTFTGDPGVVGFASGVVLSSGVAGSVVGPNSSDATTGSSGAPGDPRLDALSGKTTYDAAILEFDFIPSSTTLSFDYVFGSEEYNEWVNSPFNDVFAFWLNGVNVAYLPGTAIPVSVNNVNDGKPIGTPPISGSIYYIDNAAGTATIAGGAAAATRFAGCELDGLTVVFTVTATVVPGTINRITFAIADASDNVLDSAVFIRAGSLTSGGCAGAAAGAATAGTTTAPPLSLLPNPWRPGRGGGQDAAVLTMRSLPLKATVHVYTAGGILVRELTDADGDGLVLWDGRNAAGTPVASGVYLVVVEGPDGRRTVSRLVVAR